MNSDRRRVGTRPRRSSSPRRTWSRRRSRPASTPPRSARPAWCSTGTRRATTSGSPAYDLYRDGNAHRLARPLHDLHRHRRRPERPRYSYTVRARDLAGNVVGRRASRSPVSTPNTADLTPPTVPQNLRTVTDVHHLARPRLGRVDRHVGVTGYVVSRNGVDLPITDRHDAHTTSCSRRASPTPTRCGRSTPRSTSPTASTALPVTTHTPVENPFAAGSVWKYTDDGIDLGTAWRAIGLRRLHLEDRRRPARLRRRGRDHRDVSTAAPSPTCGSSATTSAQTSPSATRPQVNRVDPLGPARRRRRRLRQRRRGLPRQHAGRRDHATTRSPRPRSPTRPRAPTTTSRSRRRCSRVGTNVIAVEVHNESRQGLGDLSFDARLPPDYGPLQVARADQPAQHRQRPGPRSDLAWDAPVGTITGYQVFRDGILVGSPSGTTFTDTGLTSAQTYSYTVKAIGPAPANIESPAEQLGLRDHAGQRRTLGADRAGRRPRHADLGRADLDRVDRQRRGHRLRRPPRRRVLGSSTDRLVTWTRPPSAARPTATRCGPRTLAGNISAESDRALRHAAAARHQAPSVPANLRTTAATPDPGDPGVGRVDRQRQSASPATSPAGRHADRLTSATASYLDADGRSAARRTATPCGPRTWSATPRPRATRS